MTFDHVIVTTTTGSAEDAASLAQRIVDERLGACVQSGPITSFYVWQGETALEAETLLTIKTRSELLERLTAFIEEHHPYDTPEVVAVPVVGGSAAYLGWVDESTQPG
jgi:periplasmic divalent cation tolerance protein